MIPGFWLYKSIHLPTFIKNFFLIYIDKTSMESSLYPQTFIEICKGVNVLDTKMEMFIFIHIFAGL